MRSGVLFLILFAMTLYATTRGAIFRDSVFAFILTPSPRAWAAVAGSVENPPLLVTLWLLLYGGYLLYYVNTTRKPVEA